MDTQYYYINMNVKIFISKKTYSNLRTLTNQLMYPRLFTELRNY